MPFELPGFSNRSGRKTEATARTSDEIWHSYDSNGIAHRGEMAIKIGKIIKERTGEGFSLLTQ